MKSRTSSRTYVGQNIKGTPSMPFRKVRHDLQKVRAKASAYGLQEFKWRWYWRAMDAVMTAGAWGMYPTRKRGLDDPIHGAQAVGFRRSMWRRVGQHVHVLMEAKKGVSDTRMLRALLLSDKKTGLKAWHGSTHFIVGADRDSSARFRKDILIVNLNSLNTFLKALKRTGYPVIFEFDGNIHEGTEAFDRLNRIVTDLGGVFHGDLGVEYTITIDSPGCAVVVEETFTIPTSELFTDHEGRGIKYHLQEL